MRRAKFAVPIVLAASTIMGAWQAYRIIRAPSLDKWVETPATVDEAKIDVRRGRRGRPTEYAVIKYSYRFADQHHYGSHIWFFDSFRPKASEFEWVGHLANAKAASATVPCFVNPDDPREAILSRERSPFALPGWIALMLVGPGVLMIYIRQATVFPGETTGKQSSVRWRPWRRPSASGFD